MDQRDVQSGAEHDAAEALGQLEGRLARLRSLCAQSVREAAGRERTLAERERAMAGQEAELELVKERLAELARELRAVANPNENPPGNGPVHAHGRPAVGAPETQQEVQRLGQSLRAAEERAELLEAEIDVLRSRLEESRARSAQGMAALAHERDELRSRLEAQEERLRKAGLEIEWGPPDPGPRRRNR